VDTGDGGHRVVVGLDLVDGGAGTQVPLEADGRRDRLATGDELLEQLLDLVFGDAAGRRLEVDRPFSDRTILRRAARGLSAAILEVRAARSTAL
jgi:hypothetical protein